jgi:hypothetical protein
MYVGMYVDRELPHAPVDRRGVEGGATLLPVDASVLVALLLGALLVFAALIHEWWVIALPLTLIPLFYAGLASGWWGAGVGDGWQFVAAAATALALLAATLGVAVGRVATRGARRDRPRVRR